MARKSKIQRLIDKIDKINCDPEGDMLEYEDVCAELGEEVYCKALQQKEGTIFIKTPRRLRES